MTTVGMILNAIFGQPKRQPPDKVEPRQRTLDVLPEERRRLEEVKRRADRKRSR